MEGKNLSVQKNSGDRRKKNSGDSILNYGGHSFLALVFAVANHGKLISLFSPGNLHLQEDALFVHADDNARFERCIPFDWLMGRASG